MASRFRRPRRPRRPRNLDAEVYGAEAARSGYNYSARLVHKISPSPDDVYGPIRISHRALTNKATLGAELRVRDLLERGESVRAFRVEGNRVTVFPSRGPWHSIILTRVRESLRS